MLAADHNPRKWIALERMPRRGSDLPREGGLEAKVRRCSGQTGNFAPGPQRRRHSLVTRPTRDEEVSKGMSRLPSVKLILSGNVEFLHPRIQSRSFEPEPGCCAVRSSNDAVGLAQGTDNRLPLSRLGPLSPDRG